MCFCKPQTWGVVTSSSEKAFRVFKEVEAQLLCLTRRVYYPDRETPYMYDEFNNGVRLHWLHPTENVCGARFRRVWIDSELSEEYVRKILGPMLIDVEPDGTTYI